MYNLISILNKGEVMKNNNLKKAVVSMILLLSVNAAIAVPWCHFGTIVTIQNVTWSQNNIIANYPGPIPVGLADVGITSNSMGQYASTFVGGGGSLSGYTVPGSGSVIAKAYAPSSYLSSNYYSTSQGVQFKLNKCYTIPPMTAVKEIRMASNPANPDTPVIGVEYSALEGGEEMCRYWSAPVTDPDEDEDFDGDKQTTNGVTLVLKRNTQGYCR